MKCTQCTVIEQRHWLGMNSDCTFPKSDLMIDIATTPFPISGGGGGGGGEGGREILVSIGSNENWI